MSMHERTGPKRGMTLVEVMVAVGIIVILVAIFVTLARTVVGANRAQVARGTIATLETALAAYTQYWKPLIANGRGWPAEVATGSGVFPMRVPGLPPLTFGRPPLTFDGNASFAWDTYGNGPVPVSPMRPTGSGLWVREPTQDGTTPIFQANQCLAWALTADIGGGPFLGDLGASVRKPGAYTDPVTETEADGVGPATYPDANPSDAVPPLTKVNLVDPWGRPYLYGWEVQVDTSNPAKTTARFVKAWIASSGPDRSIDPNGQLWIRDAKNAGSRGTGRPTAAENMDNIVP